MSDEKDQELYESSINYNPETVIHQDKLYCKIVHNLNLIHEEYRKQNQYSYCWNGQRFSSI